MPETLPIPDRLVIAIGGNATHPEGIRGTSLEQAELAAATGKVIAGGGGGIPVIRGPHGQRHGVEAVVDKDRTSALIANVLGIEDLMILTAVPRVAINFGKPNQRFLDRVSISEITRLHQEGHFPPGSMGPKIDAAIAFVKGGGRRVMIGALNEAVSVLKGEAGTHIVAD